MNSGATSLWTVNVELKLPDHIEHFQMTLDPDQPTQQYIRKFLLNGGLYEEDTIVVLRSVLRPGDVFLDIGAHVGYFSLFGAAMVGSLGHVFAFEPDTANFSALCHNRDQNRLRQITTKQVALSERCERRAWYTNLDNDGGHSLGDIRKHSFNRKSAAAAVPPVSEIDTETLDHLSPEIGTNVRAIKIDAEGAELAILKGGVKLLEQSHPVVICEINGTMLTLLDSSVPELTQFMSELGYECRYAGRHDEAYACCKAVFNVVFVQRGKAKQTANLPNMACSVP